MARPKKSEAPDLADRVNLTAGAIERLTCPAGKQQAFMRDSEAPGLRVRVTAAGAKSFVYEAKLAACRTFIPGEAFAQNLSEFGALQGKSCFANVVSTWTFAL